jgi:addiction module HigA family antidote
VITKRTIFTNSLGSINMTTPAFVKQSNEAKRPESHYRPHPCEIFNRRCLSKTTLNQKEIAKRIGISTKHLSRFSNGHVHVGVELARKLEACTNISAYSWLNYRTQYDLSKTHKYETSESLKIF